jgi:hypothetical protein
MRGSKSYIKEEHYITKNMFHSFLAVEPPKKKKNFGFKFKKLQYSIDKLQNAVDDLNKLSGSVGDNNVNNGESKTEDPSFNTGTMNLNSLIEPSLHYIRESEKQTYQRIKLIRGYFEDDLLAIDRAKIPTRKIKKIIILARNKEKENIFALNMQLHTQVLKLHEQYKFRLSQDNNPPFIKTFKDMKKIDQYLSFNLDNIHSLYVNYNKNYKQDKQSKLKKKTKIEKKLETDISSRIDLIIKNSDTSTIKPQEYPDLFVPPPKERQESTYTYTNFDWVSDLPTQARSDLKKWMEDVRTEKGGNLNYQRVASSKTLKDKLRPILKRYRFPQWTIFHEIPENIIRECIQWFQSEGEFDDTI